MEIERHILKKLTANRCDPYAPKVSIGMPVYNGEPSIRVALNSLLAQSFSDFELIISDNASTDGTQLICLEYAEIDERIRYVRHLDNRGARANFQFVLDEAVGEFFMWAASDDIWSPVFIEANLLNLVANDAILGSISRVVFKNEITEEPSNADSPITGNKFGRLCRFWINPGDNSRFYSLFRKNAFAGINFEAFNFHAADWLVVALLLHKGGLGAIDEVLMIRALTPSENYIAAERSANASHFTLGFPLLPLSTYYVRSLSFRQSLCILPLLLLVNFRAFKGVFIGNVLRKMQVTWASALPSFPKSQST